MTGKLLLKYKQFYAGFETSLGLCEITKVKQQIKSASYHGWVARLVARVFNLGYDEIPVRQLFPISCIEQDFFHG